MDKNTVIGFILIAVILFGFTFYQKRQATKAAEWQAQQDSIALANRLPEDTGEIVPAVPVQAPAPAPETAIYKDESLNSLHGGEGTIVNLENDKIILSLNSKGAQPWSVEVKDYRNYDSTALQIFKAGGSEYSVSIYTGEYIQTRDFNFQIAELTDSSVAFRLPFSGGGYIEQLYVLHEGQYMVDNVLSFNGMESIIPRNVYSVDIDWAVTIPRMEKSYKNESQYSKLDFYQPGDKKPVEMGRGRNGNKTAASRLSWFAFQQQFFSAIMTSKGDFASGKFAVNTKNGKITVPKGTKKGTYKIKVKVTAAGNDSYNKLTKTVTATIKVK